MNCEMTRQNLVLHRQDTVLKGAKRREFLEHLRQCETCQIEYEGLWHTAALLDSVETPIPPPDLVENIQQQIREMHKQNQVAFFANPISWVVDKLRLNMSPQFVNYAALLFYLLASVFFVKFAFFTGTPEQETGLTRMEEARLRQIRVSSDSWGSLKNRIPKADTPLIRQTPTGDHIAVPSQFFGTTAAKMWRAKSIDKTMETVDVQLAATSNEKLALFWNYIKTKL